MNQIIPVLNYSVFYGGYEPPKVPLDVLQGYDLETVILTFVGLRNSLEKNKYEHAKDGAIQNLIKDLPPEKANRLKYFMYNKHRFSLIQSAVIDKILVEIFPKLKDNKVTRAINDGQYEQRILDVLLSYNEFYYDNGIVDEMENSPELIWKVVMMQGVSRVSKADFARTGMIKHLVMLHFLKKSLGEDFVRLQQSLATKAGLVNIAGFISVFRHIFELMEMSTAFVPRLNMPDMIYRLLSEMDLIISSEAANQAHFDIGKMLVSPFFKTPSGEVILLDHTNFSLIAEQAFMYLLYHKSDLPKILKLKNMNGLYSHFGKKFYEEFLMGGLLKAMQRKGVRLVIPSDERYQADFTLVVDEKDVFLIEVKSVAMHYRIFNALSAEELRAYIDKHYADGAGTPQLERYIKYLMDDKQKPLNIQNPAKKLNIYPIIIVTDPKAATYGVNDYVGQKANARFSRFKGSFNKIMPLTMIQSDFFVENIKLLAADKTMLKKLVREYHFSIKRRKERLEKDNSTQSYFYSMMNFDQFAIGRQGAYRFHPYEIHYHLEDVFGMNSICENFRHMHPHNT